MIAIYAKCLLFCYIHIKNMSTGIAKVSNLKLIVKC